MNRPLFIIACLLISLSIKAADNINSCLYSTKELSLTISNPSDIQRQEVIEVDLKTICQQLDIDDSGSFVVKNALGQEITYQKSYDGKLLIHVSLQPNGKAVYSVTKGEPSRFKSYVYGKVYPERLDDLTWENDRSIYRIYGPALQQRGERSFGTDVWTKNTPELLAEERYRMHIFHNKSFHLDHGYGMDVYSVGASLGCGSPALMENGELIFPYCYKECKILDNGPLRFTVDLTYNTTEKGVTEHRHITLDKGSHYNKMTVWYDGISRPTSLATGVVLHDEENIILGKDYVLYADPTDNPEVHQSQIYVGTLFPEGVDETTKLMEKLNHAIGIVRQYKGSPYTYYFGSAWSNYDVRTLAHWKLLAEEYLKNIRNPITIQLTLK